MRLDRALGDVEQSAITIHRTDLVAKLESTARTDPLTGLPNRRVWDEDLERALPRARRHGGSLCLAMLDLDRFKAFNDDHDHQAGDELLAAAATAWRPLLRTADTIARYGGEEFAVRSRTAISRAPCWSSSGCSRACRSARRRPPASPSATAPKAPTRCSRAPTPCSTRPSAPAAPARSSPRPELGQRRSAVVSSARDRRARAAGSLTPNRASGRRSRGGMRSRIRVAAAARDPAAQVVGEPRVHHDRPAVAVRVPRQDRARQRRFMALAHAVHERHEHHRPRWVVPVDDGLREARIEFPPVLV